MAPGAPAVLVLLAVAGAVLGVAGLAVAVLALRRAGQATRALVAVAGPEARRTLAELAALRGETRAGRDELTRAVAGLGGALRHVAVVRYDAFGDLGGHLSWSAALLDDGGDGLVLSAIHGRTESRSYAKGVTGGTGVQPLSPEEAEAVALARGTVAGPGPSASG